MHIYLWRNLRVSCAMNVAIYQCQATHVTSGATLSFHVMMYFTLSQEICGCQMIGPDMIRRLQAEHLRQRLPVNVIFSQTSLYSICSQRHCCITWSLQSELRNQLSITILASYPSLTKSVTTLHICCTHSDPDQLYKQSLHMHKAIGNRGKR